MILWIHGFPLNATIFDDQLTIRGARHLAPDLAGFGESREVASHRTLSGHAADLIDLLDELGIDRAIVAGLSMGGYIVLELLRAAESRVRAAILVDTRETADNDAMKAHRYELAERIPREGTKPVIDEMLPKLLAPETQSSNRPLVERVRSIMELASNDGVAGALHALASRPDSSGTLAAANRPLLIVVGEHDAITPPSDAQRMASLASQARLVVVPRAGHLSTMENFASVNAAVAEFVSSLQ